MRYRRHSRALRIPHPVAAVAALVLMVTAWTGSGTVPPHADAYPAGPAAVSTAESSSGDLGAAEPVVERRPKARFSLMLFRFN